MYFKKEREIKINKGREKKVRYNNKIKRGIV